MQQPSLLGDPHENELTRVRADDPDTSHHAKLDAYPRSGTRKLRALLAFWRRYNSPTGPVEEGRYGLTDYELSVILKCLRGSASKVRGLLTDGGWVEDSGYRRATDTGSKAAVWILTPEGQRYLTARGVPR